MPKWGPLHAGKEAENVWNARLVEQLHHVGFPSADFERIFTIHKDGKEVASKPDVTFSDGGVHVVSGKFGARKELDAYTSADEYKEVLAPAIKKDGNKLGEVFAVTYPASKSEKFHLHVLPHGNRPELSFTLDSLEEVADQIATAVKGLIAELEKRQEPVLDEARRLLRWGAEDLAAALKGVGLADLESIFGGHDFFQSLLRPRLKGERRAEALHLGAAYLFLNQVLFYALLAQAADRSGAEAKKRYPQIKREHYGSPSVLRAEYFERVHAKNYEPIYGFDVAQFFKGDAAKQACESLVRGMMGLAPKMDVPDLVGQVFQTLIPLDIRKPLGAHYTNPRAAALLARLALQRDHDTVMDPACGSGTLLVAAYRRKRELAGQSNAKDLHHQFVEHEITGIDAMGFVAHLAAVNLALQQPLVETDHVRIGTVDSTTKHPGDLVRPTEAALPREFQQANLEHTFGVSGATKKKGAVKTSQAEPKAFRIDPVDLVIMNPPFTSWDNMGASYRDALKKSFSQERPDYRDAVHWKTSQQTFFLLLADRFLKPGGRIAAVLPITTFTGVAFAPLMKLLLTRYTVRYIIVGLGRSSFSEDTSLTECLLIIEKSPPPADHRFRLIGTITPPDEWTEDDVAISAEAAEAGTGAQGRIIVRDYLQEALAPDKDTLPSLILRLVPSFETARTALHDVLARTPLKMAILETCLGEKQRVKTSRWVLGGGWLVYFGSMALFGYQDTGRPLKRTERLVKFRREGEDAVLQDRIGFKEYRFPEPHVGPAIRSFSYLSGPDVTENSDQVIHTISDSVEGALTAFYGAKEAKKYISRLRQKKKQWAGGRWSALVRRGMAKVSIAGRLNIAAPGTTVFACRSNQPFLLAAYGFVARGFRSDREEKLFVLWINSTLSLLALLDRMTITEATWVRLEQYVLSYLPTPDFSALSEEQWQRVDALYREVCSDDWPSILQQLKGNSLRSRLDEGLLMLCGLTEGEAKGTASQMQAGARAAIELLASTIKKAKKAAADEDDEEMPEIVEE